MSRIFIKLFLLVDYRDDRLMIVHGYKDENVNFKHIEKLIDALVENSKPHKLVVKIFIQK